MSSRKKKQKNVKKYESEINDCKQQQQPKIFSIFLNFVEKLTIQTGEANKKYVQLNFRKQIIIFLISVLLPCKRISVFFVSYFNKYNFIIQKDEEDVEIQNGRLCIQYIIYMYSYYICCFVVSKASNLLLLNLIFEGKHSAIASKN